MRALALLLLLVATTADAKRIGVIGDSHARGGLTNPGVGGAVSRFEVARTLSSILTKATGEWRDADVQNWAIPSSAPEDWFDAGPSAEALCVGSGDPWACCTGSGTSNGTCPCDSATLTAAYPHLNAACATRTSLVSHLPTDVDVWVIIADGALIGGTASTAADDLQAFVAALEAIVAPGGFVLLTSPIHLASSGSCSGLATTNQAIRDELDARAIITGPDFYDLPALTRCPDFIHPQDLDYAFMGAAVAASVLALPTPTPAP